MTYDEQQEQRVLRSFRAMDERRKQEAVVRMERIAKTHPARAPVLLRLVAGCGPR